MRKQVEESTAAESARRATRPAAARDREGVGSRPGVNARSGDSACCEARISSPCRGNWGSRRRGPPNGVTQFLAAGQAGLKSRAPDARDEEHQSTARQGRRAADGERVTLREGGPPGGRRPFGSAEVDAMSGAQSISTRRAYGVQRVCRVWGRRAVQRLRATARDAVALHCVGAAGRSVPPRTRSWSAHIRRVLEASPFHGEGLPESVGEAAGREDPHLAGTGATVDARARPPGPAARGSCTRAEGT